MDDIKTAAAISVLIILTFLSLATVVQAATLLEPVGRAIASRLNDDRMPPVIRLAGMIPLESELLPEFYAGRDYAPAWVDDAGLLPAVDDLLEALRDSATQGLCSDEFHLPFIELVLQLQAEQPSGLTSDPQDLATLDLLLTESFFRYAQALTGARDLPRKDRGPKQGRSRLVAALEDHLAGRRLGALLETLVPRQPGYRQLREVLLEFHDLSAYGGWPLIPPGETLRPGDRGQRVVLLKQRLFLSRDLQTAAAWNETGIGEETEAGIRRFQERHGLDVDGVVGPLTLAELNVPVEERIRQIELNLMRWRQAPVDFGVRHLRVNIADFRLEVHEQGTIIMSMPVVVGTPYRKTPTFSAQMSYLEFAPYWYVPATILREDKLPLIRRDPGWLERNHYEILAWRDERPDRRLNPLEIDWSRVTSRNFPGSLRLRPGPWNPLGRVKFMFPNRYAVYLHDTNEPRLFSHEERLFSSGCIRIERALDLVQYLLEEIDGWDCERILSALEGAAPLKVDLPEKIPVHLLYFTAWVDSRQRLQFRRDIYLRDVDLELDRASRLTPGPTNVAGESVRTAL